MQGQEGTVKPKTRYFLLKGAALGFFIGLVLLFGPNINCTLIIDTKEVSTILTMGNGNSRPGSTTLTDLPWETTDEEITIRMRPCPTCGIMVSEREAIGTFPFCSEDHKDEFENTPTFRP